MHISGKEANKNGIPTVLDPVGAGASALRTDTAKELIEKISFSVIKGNASEIKILASGCGAAKGVDVSETDVVTKDNVGEAVGLAKEFAKKTSAVVVVTGKTDIVTDGDKVFLIENGNGLMGKVTGCGCMLSALIGAFAAANQDNVFVATATAVCLMGLCGEKAFERMGESDGNSSYRDYIIDAVFGLDGETLERGAKYEVL